VNVEKEEEVSHNKDEEGNQENKENSIKEEVVSIKDEKGKGVAKEEEEEIGNNIRTDKGK